MKAQAMEASLWRFCEAVACYNLKVLLDWQVYSIFVNNDIERDEFLFCPLESISG